MLCDKRQLAEQTQPDLSTQAASLQTFPFQFFGEIGPTSVVEKKRPFSHPLFPPPVTSPKKRRKEGLFPQFSSTTIHSATKMHFWGNSCETFPGCFPPFHQHETLLNARAIGMLQEEPAFQSDLFTLHMQRVDICRAAVYKPPRLTRPPPPLPHPPQKKPTPTYPNTHPHFLEKIPSSCPMGLRQETNDTHTHTVPFLPPCSNSQCSSIVASLPSFRRPFSSPSHVIWNGGTFDFFLPPPSLLPFEFTGGNLTNSLCRSELNRNPVKPIPRFSFSNASFFSVMQRFLCCSFCLT